MGPRIGRPVATLSGYAPALPTPFNDEGAIDVAAFSAKAVNGSACCRNNPTCRRRSTTPPMRAMKSCRGQFSPLSSTRAAQMSPGKSVPRCS